MSGYRRPVMRISGAGESRRTRAVGGFLLAACLLVAGGCTLSQGEPSDVPRASRTNEEASRQVTPACGAGTALPPRQGAWLGVSIDWSHDTLPDYARRLGHDPAVAVTFANMPMRALDRRNVGGAVQQAAQVNSGLLLTLEPRTGLSSITRQAAAARARQLHRYNSA